MKKQFKLYQGDNMKSLDLLPDNSVDSVVTDGPYGLSFMNRKWDYDVPSIEFWKKVYQKLKPGGHVLSFGGTRTYHRMVVNIEDAGFEIRDQVMWLYGSGFPKSHNISKAIDKVEGNERKVIGRKIQRVDGTLRNVGSIGAPFLVNGVEGSISKPTDGYIDIEEPGSENSKKYEGWGTALKPSNEPICVARKPLSEKTIAENVIKWGTGGINIDGCRVGFTSEVDKENTLNAKYTTDKDNKQSEDWGTKQIGNVSKEEGRFPANIILDETAAELLDLQSGISKSGVRKPTGKSKDEYGSAIAGGAFGDDLTIRGHNDKGGASRFFYVAKVSKKERNLGLDSFEDKKKDFETTTRTNKETADKFGCERKGVAKNTHPTLKPINLMTYLCRLVTPEGGICLDPFMGSGSTGISALLEGFRFIGMEQDKSYFDIASARIEAYEDYRKLLK